MSAGFTGHEADPVTGLTYMKARWYDPEVGIFLSEDPQSYNVADPLTLNEYIYANLNPLTFVDPYGEEGEDSGAGGELQPSAERSKRFVESGACEAMSAEDCAKVTNDALNGGNSFAGNESADDFGTEEVPESIRQLREIQQNAESVIKTGCVIAGCSEETLRAAVALIQNPPDISAPPAAWDEYHRKTKEALKTLPLAAAKDAGIDIAGGYTLTKFFGAIGALGKLARGRGDEVAGEVAEHLPVGRLDDVHDVRVPKSRYPETAGHIEDAQRAGHPAELTIERPGGAGRRSESLAGHEKVPGKDLDEYPPAMTKEGGKGASVRPVSPKDNRGAGACIGNQCRKLPDGSRIRIIVVDE